MSRIEFIIWRVTREEGCALVDGRVGDGDPIRVHDIFTAVCSYTARRDGGTFEVESGPTEPIRLIVESIEAYQRSLDFADSGLTARLRVRGDGLEKLADERILS